jgi:hypothetical protein
MARLPVLKKRRSRKQRAFDMAKSTAKVWTVVKVSSAGTRAAKKGAKAYGAAKGAKMVSRPVVKVAAIPVAVGGGVVVWRKLKKDSPTTSSSTTESEPSRSMGPVASAKTVSPPGDAAAETARSNAS